MPSPPSRASTIIRRRYAILDLAGLQPVSYRDPATTKLSDDRSYNADNTGSLLADHWHVQRPATVPSKTNAMGQAMRTGVTSSNTSCPEVERVGRMR